MELDVDDLLFYCSKFMSEAHIRMNEQERNNLDRIIEKYETTRSLMPHEIMFLKAIYRRTKIND